MRTSSVLALIASAVALSGCSGGGSSDLISGVNGLALNCDLSVTSCGTTTTPPTTPTTPAGPGTAPGGGAAGGNTTDLATGDTAMVLEGDKLNLPSSGTSLATLSATTAELLAATKPSTITYNVDTNTATNSNWAVAQPMNEYLYGTNHVDSWDTGNRGGADYHEYRLSTNETATKRDDLLQLWSWNNTYLTHYRNAVADQDSWSFGGNKTALTSMPTGGSATYVGRYVGNAVTTDFLKPDGQIIDPNGKWRTQGTAVVNANFANGTVTGLITPQTWTVFQATVVGYFTQNTNGDFYLDNTLMGNNKTAIPDTLVVNGINYGVPAYYSAIYDTTITIAGTITGNTYKGGATLNGAWNTGTNTMYGGFFGSGATETTGVFDAYGTTYDPIGGSTGLNEDRRAHIDIRGGFHGDCTAAGGTCAP